MPVRLTEDEVKKRILDKGFILPENFVYTNNRTKFGVICPRHQGAVWFTRLQTIEECIGCPECYRETKAYTTQHFLDALEKDGRGYRLAEGETYYKYYDKLRVICPEHPDRVWYTRLDQVQKGVGCEACSVDRQRKGFAWLETDEYKVKLKILSSTYINTKTKYSFLCRQCNSVFESALYDNKPPKCHVCDPPVTGFKYSARGHTYYARIGEFYKIGVTNKPDVRKRIKEISGDHEIIYHMEFGVGSNAHLLEQHILKKYAAFRCTNLGVRPDVDSGFTEMFVCDILQGTSLEREWDMLAYEMCRFEEEAFSE